MVSGTAAALTAPSGQNLSPNPCSLNQEEIDGLSVDLSVDVNAVRTYIDTVSWMLHRSRFDQLDCVANRARANKERFPGGMWKLHEMYKGLNDPAPRKHATEEDWDTILKLLQGWIDAHPKSATAWTAQAWAWISYADAARGTGYSNTVSESGWKLYEERTERAEKVLEQASTLSVRCPEYYVVKLNIAENQSWGKDRILALFNEALALEPDYYYYGRGVAMLLEPKWFGDPGDTEKFMEDVADRIGGEKGDAFYFQVASSSDVICGCDNQPQLSLERIERGYEAVEKQYGVSMLNLNRLAYMTLHDGKADVVVADKTFTRIGTQWDQDTWDDQRDFQQMKSWTAQMLPIILADQVKEKEAAANMQTPEGARYQVSFEKAYKEMLHACVQSDGGGVSDWAGKFETLVRVGANGAFEDGGISCMGPVVACVYKKMRSSYDQKSPLFPAPPKASYWVRIDLDWADFAPVSASK
jgi:hypothetical protein